MVGKRKSASIIYHNAQGPACSQLIERTAVAAIRTGLRPYIRLGGVKIMLKTGTLILLGFAATSPSYADRNVYVTGAFESGKFQPYSGQIDPFFIKTLPEVQAGNESVRTGAGGGGPTSNWDTRVVSEELVAGQLVSPRQGNFFARSTLHRSKDYTGLNGGLPKPRSAISLSPDINRFEFDEEGWLGFSIFIPKNFEDETARTGPGGSIQLVSTNVDSAAILFNLNIYVPKRAKDTHWFLQYLVDDRSVSEEKGAKLDVDLGAVEPDKGTWTDFVIRYRANPFSVTTNPLKAGIKNAKDQTYQGNKGILQVWKAEGPVDANGNREMVLKFSKVNTPIGLVPGTTQGKSLIHHSLRVYKYGWQRERTAVKGPIWIGFDELRYGQTVRDGTGYSDVHPAQLTCADGCPGGSAPPLPGDPPAPPPIVPPATPPGTEPGATPQPPEDLIIVSD